MMGTVRARVEATSAGSARLGSCPSGPPARRCWGEPLTPTGEVVGSAPTARALTIPHRASAPKEVLPQTGANDGR